MARVIVNSLLHDAMGMIPEEAQQNGSDIMLRLSAGSVRELLRQLDRQAPGCADRLRGGHIAVAIDGEIQADALLQELDENSEVCFVPAIEGG